MAKKRKTIKTTPETETYGIEVEDWEVDYHFALNTTPKGLIEGVYWEHSKLILVGKLLSPLLGKASKARIELAGDPQMDDHWKANPTIISSKAIGWMEIPRGDDTLILYCSIPSQSFQQVAPAVHSGKIRFASVFGTKLKWRKGTIQSVSLSTNREEE